MCFNVSLHAENRNSLLQRATPDSHLFKVLLSTVKIKRKKETISAYTVIWACTKELAGASFFTQMWAAVIRWLPQSCPVLGGSGHNVWLWFLCATALPLLPAGIQAGLKKDKWERRVHIQDFTGIAAISTVSVLKWRPVGVCSFYREIIFCLRSCKLIAKCLSCPRRGSGRCIDSTCR